MVSTSSAKHLRLISEPRSNAQTAPQSVTQPNSPSATTPPSGAPEAHSALARRHEARRPRPARSSLHELHALLTEIQQLPQALPHAVCALLADSNQQPVFGSVPPVEVLRQETREHLQRVAQDIETAMGDTLKAASEKWDQLDNRKFMHSTVRFRHRELLQAWSAIHTKGRRVGDASLQAAAAESTTLLQTVFALVRLLETRMATIVRLKLRAAAPGHQAAAQALGTPEAPFLPIAAALREIAAVW